MTKQEITEAAERFGDTYNREGNGEQMSWAFESGSLWARDEAINDTCNWLKDWICKHNKEWNGFFSIDEKKLIQHYLKDINSRQSAFSQEQ